MISRRTLLAASLLAGAAPPFLPAVADEVDGELLHAISELEHRHGGRLGVAVLDTAGTRMIAHRGDERFALCSTHKCLSVAFVLARVDRRQESLARRIVYSKADLVAYSPFTGQHAGAGGLSVGELCEAAMTVSDNTAANLLLGSFGGPSGLTAYMRSLGDGVTRLDRQETALNEGRPGDVRDTTTPAAMVDFLHKTVVGPVLSASSREQLTAWLVANTTGRKRLRAGVPVGWRAGDKTGSGGNNTANDVAVFWPPNRAPIIVAAYYIEAHASNDERDAVLAEVGRLAATV